MGGYYSQSTNPDNAGLFTYMSMNNLGKVPDGTSNTIAFGEFVGGVINWGGSGGIASGKSGAAWVCGFGYSGFSGPSPSGSALDSNGNSYWYTFGADHTGNIANFAFADGSVRSIYPSIDWNSWIALTGFKDGTVVSGW
jgi:prepilin-type processing-associated H-X9-DG protein